MIDTSGLRLNKPVDMSSSCRPDVGGSPLVSTDLRVDVDQCRPVSTDAHYDNLKNAIDEYVLYSVGWFSSGQIDAHFQLTTRQQKQNRWKILKGLAKERKLEKHTGIEGTYRYVRQESDEIDWKNASLDSKLKLFWPFGLEKYVDIYPKNVIVIAGSPNAGKSAFLFNLIMDNMLHHEVVYFSSEMGAEEMLLRLSNFPLPVSEWNFKAFERSTNFSDVIRPDAINIVDFLEVTDNFYKVGEDISSIFNKLGKGIAVIALQKKKGAELGRGAEFSLEKPRLYLSMDSGELKIIKAKNWAGEENPNGISWKFRLHKGSQFEVI